MRIMGIDPGLADVGYGIVEALPNGRTVSVAYGVIQTHRAQPLAARLFHIHRELENLITLHRPEAVAIEEIFFSNNLKTAVAVAQARGVAILATARADVPLAEYSPPRIKLAVTGSGRAGKAQVQLMVRAVLGLAEIPQPDHAADALAVALCHLHSLGTAARRAEAIQSDPANAPGSTANLNKQLLAQVRGARRRRR